MNFAGRALALRPAVLFLGFATARSKNYKIKVRD